MVGDTGISSASLVTTTGTDRMDQKQPLDRLSGSRLGSATRPVFPRGGAAPSFTGRLPDGDEKHTGSRSPTMPPWGPVPGPTPALPRL